MPMSEDAMDNTMGLYKALDDYIEYWRRFSGRRADMLMQYVDPAFFYRSPTGHIESPEDFIAVTRLLYRRLKNIKVAILGRFIRPESPVAIVQWQLEYISTKSGERSHFDGISEIGLSKQGKVLSQRDYWHDNYLHYARAFSFALAESATDKKLARLIKEGHALKKQLRE